MVSRSGLPKTADLESPKLTQISLGFWMVSKTVGPKRRQEESLRKLGLNRDCKTKVKTAGVSYALEEYVKEQCWVAVSRPH